MPIDVTDTTFTDALNASPSPAVVEFYAPWCGNCRRIAPALENLEADFSEQARLLMVNAEANPELVARYGVSSTPTIIALAGAEPLVTVVGAQRTAVLRDVFAAAVHGSSPTAATSWVPEDACTLSQTDQSQRLDEFAMLFARGLDSIDRRETTWLHLEFSSASGIEGQVRDLTAREAECCGFFDFDVQRTVGGVSLDVRVPTSHVDVLAGMQAQAIATAAGTNAEATSR